ncbi:MAG: cytochrome d ubiquinol oxidase subunit II [Chloroflexi bacterium]|nr:MAG: cytochrome d ubiquinol oxidase subunit II [Chloroflexota bacterium]
MNVALFALVILWWGLIAYAVLGGADFGAGIWDLFVGREAERQRSFINHALGPVWEANHTWLIFSIVGVFNVFPAAFALLSIALFVPFTLALIGVVLRGAAFIFRYYAPRAGGNFARWWGRVFSISSILTPFFLGASAAAVASGKLLRPDGIADATYIVSWTSPFAITIGAMAVALCATLSAVYLVVEANQAHEQLLTESYRRKALWAGAVTAVLGALGLGLSVSEAPLLWSGMVARAVPVVVATMLIGLATATTLYIKRYRIARLLIISETAFLLGSWGLSQYPYIIPPQATIANSANEPSVILMLLITIACGLAILLPSLYYLFSVFKLPYPVPGLRKSVEREREAQQNDSVQQPL